VEHYRRQDQERWLLIEYRDPEDRIEIESLDCRRRLGDLYERVPLPLGGAGAAPDSALLSSDFVQASGTKADDRKSGE
jgi:hypothetical protein